MSKAAAGASDGPESNKDKTALIKAIELIIAKPESVTKEMDAILAKYRKRYKEDANDDEITGAGGLRKGGGGSGDWGDGSGDGGDGNDDEIRELVAKKVIQNYSYLAAFSGGVTALAGVVPGLGTVVAVAGGTTADIALCMKFQIEMVMAIANVYGHNILEEEERRLCFIIAGLGAINKAGQAGAKEAGSKAFVKMVEQYLKGPTLAAVKEIFKKVGITFTRKGLVKAIPFGIGTLVGFAANKTMTWYVGVKARGFFRTN